MRPEDVLFGQVDLLQKMEDPRYRRIVTETLAASGNREMISPAMNRQNAEYLVQTMRNHVRAAYAYRVTADMSVMVQHIANTLDSTDRFMADLAPTDNGIVRFDRPLPLRDARGKMMKIHWLTWGRVSVSDTPENRRGTSAVFTAHYNDLTDPDEISEMILVDHPEHRRLSGRFAFIGGSVAYSGMQVGAELQTLSQTQYNQILADGDTPTDFTNTDRYLHALWMLLSQSITVVEDEHVRKTVRKMVGRRGIPDRVSVIRLRRSEGARRAEGESMVEWTHRWLSRAHPRWQPRKVLASADHDHQYGPIQVEAGHSVRYCQVRGCEAHLARIIVKMSIKGPEGAPLIITEKVYDLAR